MTPERFARMSEILQAAAELAEDRRAEFLDRACGADGELRGEIESLLGHFGPPSFLEDRSLARTRALLEAAADPIEADAARATLAADPTVAELPPQVGRYRILGVLGQGAAGTVYRAVDPTLDREVAIKLVTAGPLGGAARDRFLREARAAARLQHPNVVGVFDSGTESGRPFIAMELLEGEDLKARLRREPRLEVRASLDVLVDVLRGLEHAHAMGVVHRDIKPANIFLLEGGGAKLLDFSIAQLASEERITQSGAVLGTPDYMAPEQVEGGSADARADLFSVGAVAYELLVGERPFAAETMGGVLFKVVHAAPRPFARADDRIAQELEAIVFRALSKRPADRPGSAAELGQALSQVRDRAAASGSLLPVTFGDVADRARSRRRRLALLGAVSGLAAAVAFAIRSSPPPPGDTPAAARTPAPASRAVRAGDADAEGAPTPSAAVATHAHAHVPAEPPAPSLPAAPTRPPAATLRVIAESGAAVFVDGQLAGHGGRALGLELPPGEHRLRVVRPGHHHWEQPLSLAAGSARELDVRLEPLPARIAVSADVAGATILVNGKELASGTVELSLAPGDHAIDVAAPGFEPWRELVTLGPGEERKVEARLAARAATLVVEGAPREASLFVDGAYAGRAPEPLALAPGAHDVRVAQHGYEPWEGRVILEPGRRVAIPVALARLSPPEPQGGLRLAAAPARGWELYVDGRREASWSSLSSAPLVIELAAGEHAIEFRHAAYRPVRRIVTIEPERTLEFELELEDWALAR